MTRNAIWRNFLGTGTGAGLFGTSDANLQECRCATRIVAHRMRNPTLRIVFLIIIKEDPDGYIAGI
jgi:hypothetical protein